MSNRVRELPPAGGVCLRPLLHDALAAVPKRLQVTRELFLYGLKHTHPRQRVLVLTGTGRVNRPLDRLLDRAPMPLRASFCESFASHSQSGSLTPRSWNRD